MSKNLLAIKLIDKSLILCEVISNDETTITVKAPYNVTQMINPATGQPEMALIPLDLIFADVEESKNSITFKKEHIMWEKDLSDFPNYKNSYLEETTGIATVQSEILKG